MQEIQIWKIGADGAEFAEVLVFRYRILRNLPHSSSTDQKFRLVTKRVGNRHVRKSPGHNLSI